MISSSLPCYAHESRKENIEEILLDFLSHDRYLMRIESEERIVFTTQKEQKLKANN